jgi:ABC-type uncharacterized transport system permease subunit
METILNELASLIIYSYTGTVILLTFIILRDFIKSPKSYIKTLTAIVVGIALGVVWYYIIGETQLDKLFYSFTFASACYSMIIKPLMKRFNIEYNNDKGII